MVHGEDKLGENGQAMGDIGIENGKGKGDLELTKTLRGRLIHSNVFTLPHVTL